MLRPSQDIQRACPPQLQEPRPPFSSSSRSPRHQVQQHRQIRRCWAQGAAKCGAELCASSSHQHHGSESAPMGTTPADFVKLGMFCGRDNALNRAYDAVTPQGRSQMTAEAGSRDIALHSLEHTPCTRPTREHCRSCVCVPPTLLCRTRFPCCMNRKAPAEVELRLRVRRLPTCRPDEPDKARQAHPAWQ